MHNDNDLPFGATTSVPACGDCPAAAASRRAFLRDVAVAVAGALALGVAGAPARALAESLVETKAISRRGNQKSYLLPRGNSIAIDAGDDVVIARWENRVYAFSLRCPHRGTKLEWLDGEKRIFCPKHKARFQPNGSHESGRQSRDLDRYALRLQDDALLVDLDLLYRSDRDPDAWRNAVIVIA